MELVSILLPSPFFLFFPSNFLVFLSFFFFFLSFFFFSLVNKVLEFFKIYRRIVSYSKVMLLTTPRCNIWEWSFQCQLVLVWGCLVTKIICDFKENCKMCGIWGLRFKLAFFKIVKKNHDL
jgi:hypothetical protein